MQGQNGHEDQAKKSDEGRADAAQHPITADDKRHREKRTEDRNEVMLAKELIERRPEVVQFFPDG